MAQFSSKTLARLLLNVDRAILREAVDLAELWDVFSSFERDALVQLGQEQNLLANLQTFGPDALRALSFEFFERVKKIANDAPMLVRLQFEGALHTWELINDVRDIVNTLAGPGEPGADDISTAISHISNTINILASYLNAPHETHHPLPAADAMIVDARERAQAARLALGFPG